MQFHKCKDNMTFRKFFPGLESLTWPIKNITSIVIGHIDPIANSVTFDNTAMSVSSVLHR